MSHILGSKEIFYNNIDKNKIKIAFEIGSRDIEDAIIINNIYNCKVYAFECNPDCLEVCRKKIKEINNDNIILIEKAVHLEDNNDITFYPFDLNKYDNMGASSFYKIDFVTTRNKNDADYNRPNPQKEIKVPGTRLDTFMKNNNIDEIDLIFMDVQGYELNAIKSLGDKIKNVKYIFCECSIISTYENGCSFKELYDYLIENNFRYVSSSYYNYNLPDLTIKHKCEFDSLFVNKNYQ